MIKVSGLTFLLIIEFIVVLAGLGIFSFLKNKKLSKRSETQNKDNPKKHKEDAQMKTEETSNKTEESTEAKAKEAPTAADNGAPAKTDVTAKNTEAGNEGKTEEAAAAKTEPTTGTAEKNDNVNIDDPLEAGSKDSAETKTEKTPEEATEDVEAKSEEDTSMAKEDGSVKAKEADTTAESADTKSEEEAGQGTAGKTGEDTLDLIEEVEEVSGTTDENSEVKAEGGTEPAADSPETKGSEEAEKTAEIEEVKETFNAADESSGAKAKSPSNDKEVKSVDIKDFKKLLEEREAERQSLKNKVTELEETLTKKTQELDQKIGEYKSFQENEKELLAIYKELKESSVAP